VVFPAVDGLTGVLPRHAQMVAALGPGEMTYKRSGSDERYFVSGGFAEVHDDTMRVITEASERPSEIDVERAERAAQRARDRMKARLADEGEPLDVMRAETSLLRALARIRIAEHS
jgi:F-type H+-transporting ATPase subunit epsilon